MNDDNFIEVSPTRIFGMGLGTWIILMASMFVLFLFLVTDPLNNFPKWTIRTISSTLLAVLFLLLIFAERSERFEGQGAVTTVCL